MRTVGIRDLKDNLSRYVRAAEAGETLLISDRERVVARLAPATSASAGEADPLAGLVRRGLLTPAKDPPGPPPDAPRGTLTLDEVLRGLDEDRADRW